MIQKGTYLKVADNSGAKRVACIGLPGNTRQRAAGVGEVIKVSVKQAIPSGKVKKGEMCRALIVRTRSKIVRDGGTSVMFDDNAVVLINNQGDCIGTRVFGAVSQEVRDRGFNKVVSLALTVV